MAAITPLLDFDKLRADAMDLVKRAGRKAACKILRTVEATPTDPSKPWRVGTGTTLEFPFQGVVTVLGFSARSDPVFDGDIDVIAPGDLADTAALTDPNTLCGDPTEVDRIDVGGVQYQIMGITPVQPYDKVIIYKMRGKPWPSLIKPQ